MLKTIKKTTVGGFKFSTQLKANFFQYLERHNDILLKAVRPPLIVSKPIVEITKGKINGKYSYKKKVIVGAITYRPEFLIQYNGIDYYVDVKNKCKLGNSADKVRLYHKELYQKNYNTQLIIASTVQDMEDKLHAMVITTPPV